jgi:hypothetical protein
MKFNLRCNLDHDFEGWFPNKDELLKQIGKGLVECPYCGTINVKKTLSSPNISTKSNKKLTDTTKNLNSSSSKLQDVNDNFESKNTVFNNYQLRKIYKNLQKTIEKEFTNVGSNFANEARKIHYGEKKPKNIYGKCSESERVDLEKEGVDFASIPWVSRDN